MITRFITAFLLMVGLTALPATASTTDVAPGDDHHDENTTILGVAEDNPERFSVLLEAVRFAQGGEEGVLTEALTNETELTLFAPTNEAFVSLLGKLNMTKEELFAPGNEDLVRAILQHHLLVGSQDAEALVATESAQTLQQAPVMVKTTDNGAMVGNADCNYVPLLETDVQASNGVIHIVGDVLLFEDSGLCGVVAETSEEDYGSDSDY